MPAPTMLAHSTASINAIGSGSCRQAFKRTRCTTRRIVSCKLFTSSTFSSGVVIKSLSHPSRGTAASASAQPASVLQSSSLESAAWASFVEAVSGEWDGVAASFNTQGEPLELPPYYVPGAFREWGVTLYDWQTQSSCAASSDGLSYTVRKLFPTVGCEADAVAFEEEAVTGLRTATERAGEDKTILRNGGYTLGARELPAQGPTPGTLSTLTLELCMADTQPRASPSPSSATVAALATAGKRERVKVVLTLARGGPAAAQDQGQEAAWWLRQADVSRERFDRPWDGKQELGGCGGGIPAFAAGTRTNLKALADLEGQWTAGEGAVYVLDEAGAFRLAGDAPLEGTSSWGSTAGSPHAVALPLGIWISVSGSAGDLMVEAGTLLEDGKIRKVAGRRFAGGRLHSTWMGTDVLRP